MPAADRPALVIDASEWFHDPAWQGHVTPRHWRRLPKRSAFAVHATLQRCADAAARATWFVTGELARTEPTLLRELAAAGHELGLALLAPWPLDAVPAAERQRVAAAWAADRAAIEAATGQGVCCVRAVWPVGAGEAWWRTALPGIACDASPRTGARDAKPPCEVFAAWRLDPDQPRAVGLPKAVFAAHYDRLATAAAEFAVTAARANGTLAAGLGLPPTAPTHATAAAPRATPAPTGAEPLCIVVPLKDEAAGLGSLFTELDHLVAQLADVAACEFVFVDDGSTDATWSLLQQFAAGRPHMQLVQHAHNRGVAAAIRSGIHAARCERVASIDGDLSYDPMELRAMLARLGEADVVTASPYHPAGGVHNVPGWRLLLSRTLSAVYRLLLWSPLHTWTACFRVYRRSVVVDLPLSNPGFLGTAELLVRVLRRGGRVVEHPCVLEARLFGFSKMRVLRTILGHLRLLVQVALRRVR